MRSEYVDWVPIFTYFGLARSSRSGFSIGIGALRSRIKFLLIVEIWIMEQRFVSHSQSIPMKSISSIFENRFNQLDKGKGKEKYNT